MSRLNWGKVNLLTLERNRKNQYSSDNLLAPLDRSCRPKTQESAQETKTESIARPRLIKKVPTLQENKEVKIAAEVIPKKTSQGQEKPFTKVGTRILKLRLKK